MYDSLINTTLIPPAPRLLISNDEPTAEEHVLIAEVIKAVQEEVALRQSLPQASGRDYRRDGELIAFVRYHKAVVSAFRRLPTELLCIIFAHFANGSRPDLDHPPYRLGHVCRRWRSIVLSMTPAIYTVTMPIRITKRHSKQGLNRGLRLILEEVPLYSCKLSSIYDSGHPIMAWFLARTKRWKTASLTIHPRSSLALSLSGPLKVPNLETLHLCFTSPPPLAHAIHPCDAFATAPSLRELNLEALIPPFELKVPWHQLTKYAERSLQPFCFPSLLQSGRGARLESLTYIALESSNVTGDPACPTTLPRLAHLDVRLYHANSTALLDTLVLPALRELRVRDLQNPRLLRDITALLFRSSGFEAHLARLAVYAQSFAPLELTRLLRRTPRLVELECGDIPMEDLANVLTPGGEIRFEPVEPGSPYPSSPTQRLPSTLPQLRKLTIYSPSKATVSSIDSLIDSRLAVITPTPGAPHRAPLDVVRLVFPDAGSCDEAASALDISSADDPYALHALSRHLSDLDALTESYKLDTEPGIFQAVSSWMAGRSLDSVLTALEHTPLHDPKLIEVRALSTLHKLYTLDSHRIPQEPSSAFLRRARSLLDVWGAAFRARPSGERWVRHGLRSVLYVRREGEGGCWHDRFVHGEHCTVDDPEMFWPYREVL